MVFVRICITLFSLTMLSCCQASVTTGLDNVTTYQHLFDGKRIGIVTNHTAYSSDGRYIVDVFRDMRDVTTTALFSPEHGLYGAEGAGKKINSQIHPVYQLPIYSLYGDTRKPTPQMLENIDILVFDIQDIGARFYTYIYTMSLAMEAAAEQGKPFVVLDRPNPINGVRVEGNILQPQFASFVGLYPIAVRHGMTVGELAKMFNEQGWLANAVTADLKVVPMEGWRRTMWYDETGLVFRKPSPNIPNLETATVYPGLCLLEGTNVSEARGTATPFLEFGAPWIDPQKLTARLNKLNLPGMRFEPTSFTPTASKYQGQNCHGVKIVITDRNLLEPFFSGVLIVNEIYSMYPNTLKFHADHFDRLCGTAAIRNAIINESSLDQLRQSWRKDQESFLQIRRKHLLYPK